MVMRASQPILSFRSRHGARRVAVILLAVGMLSRSSSAQLPPAGDAPIATSASASDIAQEFQELDAHLAVMLGHPDHTSLLAERLAVFPLRFGMELRDTPQWPAFQAKARGMLDEFDAAKAHGPSEAVPPEKALTDLWSRMSRCTLLEIVGRPDEAQALLDAAVVFGFDGCQHCTADNGLAVYQRRSEHSEWAGDLQGALRWQHDACFESSTALTGINFPVCGPMVHARYGLLLCRTGHVEAGALVLRSVLGEVPPDDQLTDAARRARADLQPIGAPTEAQLAVAPRIARAELQRLGVPTDGSKIDLDEVVLSWGGYWRSSAALLLTDEGRPGWVEILAVRLAHEGDEWGSRTVAFDAEAFDHLRPAVEKVLLHDDYGLWSAGPALRVAQGLRGGAEPYVDRLLDRMTAAGTEIFSGTEGIDTALRWRHGGVGPAFPGTTKVEGAQFAAAWREWRAAHPR
jgi:hypothetical protein